jgi:hypothetical protein
MEKSGVDPERPRNLKLWMYSVVTRGAGSMLVPMVIE